MLSANLVLHAVVLGRSKAVGYTGDNHLAFVGHVQHVHPVGATARLGVQPNASIVNRKKEKRKNGRKKEREMSGAAGRTALSHIT